MSAALSPFEASGLTPQEAAVVAALIVAWNAFVMLPVEHGDDLAEFRHGIHALQHQIFARPALRKFNAAEPGQ